MPGPKNIALGTENGKFIIYTGIRPLVEIPLEDIVSLTLDKASKRSAGKAAAGAIIGGALTGGIGLLAGAAIGGRKKMIVS